MLGGDSLLEPGDLGDQGLPGVIEVVAKLHVIDSHVVVQCLVNAIVGAVKVQSEIILDVL